MFFQSFFNSPSLPFTFSAYVFHFQLIRRNYFSLRQALKSLSGMEDLQIWNEKVKQWLKEQYSPENYLSFEESSSDNKVGSDTNTDLPIWIAAQRAVPRYRGLLSPVGPRGRLIRKLLTWTGLIPSLPEASNYCDIDMKYSENYLRLVLTE